MSKNERRLSNIGKDPGVTRRLLLTGIVLAFTALFLSLLALKLGSVKMSVMDAIKALFWDSGSEIYSYYVRQLRLPRVISALAVGSILSLSGVILQNVLNNPLASSFTLGISQGAAFGASLAIITLTGYEFSFFNLSLISFLAFLGSIVTAMAILAISLLKGMTTQGLVLAGVAISSLFGAATMFMQFFATETQVAATLFWTFGDLGRGGWSEALVTLFAALLFLGATMRLSFSYDAMAWGDHTAHGLGVSVKGLRVVSLLMAAFTTAVATSFFGVIGFVGLICPHMVRLALPRIRHEFLILFSSLAGGTFVLAADILAQRILYPVAVPIGIISAFAGVPMFLALLIRGGIKDASRS